MKRLLLLFVSLYLLHIPSFLFADDCTDALEEAKSCYEQGDYMKAKALFEYVQAECGDDYGDVVTWISKCANVSHNIVTKDFVVNGVSFKMVYVQGGTFNMGATDEQGKKDSESALPVHKVTVSDFYMSQTEVTQALWQCVMGSDVNEQSKKGTYRTLLAGVGNSHPMYYISWNDCQKFITKLNQLTGEQFRMPTEAEWEFAARGGVYSKGYKYAGSNVLKNVAWYYTNSSSTTHPVALKEPNELGLYDMCGNVQEWCLDLKGDYTNEDQYNPQGAKKGSYRIVRGGCHYTIPIDTRISARYWTITSDRNNALGLRLVMHKNTQE